MCKPSTVQSLRICFGEISRWPHGLRRRSAAIRLLGSPLRIPRGHGCLSLVSVVCFHVEASTTGQSLVHRSRTECVCMPLSVIRCNSNTLHQHFPNYVPRNTGVHKHGCQLFAFRYHHILKIVFFQWYYTSLGGT